MSTSKLRGQPAHVANDCLGGGVMQCNRLQADRAERICSSANPTETVIGQPRAVHMAGDFEWAA
jgi:hypothetical protein